MRRRNTELSPNRVALWNRRKWSMFIRFRYGATIEDAMGSVKA